MSYSARAKDLARTTERRPATAAIAVVIPAYKPGASLLELISHLSEIGFESIVVVDDGSGEAYTDIFQGLVPYRLVRLLRHAANLGKGAALKTGINTILCEYPEVQGIVTVDADGQHLPDDVAKVCSEFQNSRNVLALGARSFDDSAIPFRSRLGNKITRKVLGAVLGTPLQDTQTGLRVIPRDFALHLLRISSSGYDFELDMLVTAKELGIPLLEVPIATVYEPGNRSSHFNPLIDSMKIYFVLLRFCSVSLLSALIDNGVFLIAFQFGHRIGVSQLVGRCVSIFFYYFSVRTAVFNSRKKHAVAGPEFLALAAVTGLSSYALIQFVTGTWGISVVTAKLMVETALFFVSFAVQRDLIFTRDLPEVEGTLSCAPNEPLPPETPSRVAPSKLYRTLLWLTLTAVIAAFAVGFAQTGLSKEEITTRMWTLDGWDRYTRFAFAFGVIACAFGVFARRWFLPAIASAAALCTAFAVGPLPVLWLVFFVFCCTVVARGLFGTDLPWILAFCGGLGLVTAVMRMLRDVPIHYAAVYVITAIALLVLFRSSTLATAKQFFLAFRNPPQFPISAFIPLVLASFAILTIWIMVLEPEVGPDALAMHLKIPASMAIHHAFIFDFRNVIWALMPMGADLAYAVMYAGGGEFGARLLNLFMLVALALLVYDNARRFLGAAMAILLSAAFVSTPLGLVVTSSLMVENFGATFLLACISAVCLFDERGTARLFLLSSLLIGIGVAFKIGVVPMAGVIAGFLVVAAVRKIKTGAPLGWPVYLGAVSLFLLTALWTYVAAWLQSGSPVYPWALGPFKPVNIHPLGPDRRFMQPLAWNTLFKLTFHTTLYSESRDKSFGFQYLLFVPLAFAAIFGFRSWRFRLAISSGLVGALAILATVPNARYLYPTTALLTVAFAGALAFTRSVDQWLYRICCSSVVAVVILNLVCFAIATWDHNEFYSPPLFKEKSRLRNIRKHAPQREIIAYLNREDPTHPVLFPDNDLTAGLVPPVFENSWHEPVFASRLAQCTTPSAVFKLVKQLGIEHIAAPVSAQLEPAVAPAIKELLGACGREEFGNKGYASFKLVPDCEAKLAQTVQK